MKVLTFALKMSLTLMVAHASPAFSFQNDFDSYRNAVSKLQKQGYRCSHTPLTELGMEAGSKSPEEIWRRFFPLWNLLIRSSLDRTIVHSNPQAEFFFYEGGPMKDDGLPLKDGKDYSREIVSFTFVDTTTCILKQGNSTTNKKIEAAIRVEGTVGLGVPMIVTKVNQ